MDRLIGWLRLLSSAGSQFIRLFRGPQQAPLTPDSQDLFGKNQEVEAFAFSGGGFDALMELGVVHALIIREHRHPDRGRLPHAFSGVSSGAVMAAVAAEVLRRGAELQPPDDQAAARVARFRQMLHQFLEAPLGLIESLLPDLYEVKSGRPLKSFDLPVHNARERRDRAEAIEARAGFITLINGALSTSLPIAAVTRFLRLQMSARAAREELSCWRHEWGWRTPRFRRLGRLCAEAWRLLFDSLILALRYGSNLCEVMFRLYFLHLAGGLRLLCDGVVKELTPGSMARDGLRVCLVWLTRSATTTGNVLSLERRLLAQLWWWTTRVVSITLWYGILMGGVLAVAWHGFAKLLTELSERLVDASWTWAPAVVARITVLLTSADAFAAYPHVAFMATVTTIAVLLVLWLPFWVLDLPFDRSFLRALSLDRDILADYGVRRFLIQLFDPDYYGPPEGLPSLVGRALRDEGPRTDLADHDGKRTLWDLSVGDRLHVAPAVVDVTKGQLEVLHDTLRPHGATRLQPTRIPVVDALLASVSRVPFLRAQQVEAAGPTSFYIDASNIASEPLNGLMDYLRDRIHPSARSLTVYAVTPFPVTKPAPSEPPGEPLLGAARVLDRVRDLRRYQIAKVDRQLTSVYTQALSHGHDSPKALTEINDAGRTRRFLAAKVLAIETPKPLRVYRQMLKADSDLDRRKAVLAVVAEGCKASLQVFEKEALDTEFGKGERSARCPAVLGRGLVVRGTTGLPEICAVCDQRFQRAEPIRHDTQNEAAAKALQRAEPNALLVGGQPSRNTEAPEAPWSVVVLSGGVFRGVFQVGVVAGGVEAGVEPKLLVGSSVGSLMMTAAAKIWSTTGDTPALRRERRLPQVRQLAATFLALDRFVMTDRFSDFVRRVTLRAGYTNVSIKDIDRALRTYAELGPGRFSNTTRRVVAAFERLAYITPFELIELARAGREERWYDLRQQLLEAAQNFLDRSGVRDEVLGADPLLLLIETLGMPAGNRCAAEPQFDCYQNRGLYRLVTATNLQAGSLEVFGMNASAGLPNDVSFTETLLASGAFPLVFRPRLQSDLQPGSADFAQYTDGGVMDNLPLYSVAQFLANADRSKLTVRRPTTAPHLVITGSLEPEFRKRSLHARQAEYWPAVQKRVARIAYNSRPLGFAQAQENFELIYNHQQTLDNPRPFAPLRMRLSVIRAQWLCDTFGFHPMLGFSRVKQARSIAHGCASTLAYLSAEAEDHPAWAKAWGLELGADQVRRDCIVWTEQSRQRYHKELKRLGLEAEATDAEATKALPPPTLRQAPRLWPNRSGQRASGTCWFRTAARCPFSREAAGTNESDEQITWLDLIYHECGKARTHEPIES